MPTQVDGPASRVTDFERPLSEQELVARCDRPPVEWRSDCYASRPPRFVFGEGGCARLGGYLAVWYGTRSDDPDHEFRVGDDTWTIWPESD